MRIPKTATRETFIVIALLLFSATSAFTPSQSLLQRKLGLSQSSFHYPGNRYNVRRNLLDEDRSDAEVEEEVRLQVLEARRKQIRSTLKSAENIRNLRIKNGWVPELDEDGKPIKSDGKVAVSLTAFVVAAGAIALRVGGRAALVSTLGLDFFTDNPQLKDNLDKILDASDNMDLLTKLALFTAGWTAVKVLCFDAGGIALALSAGILFGGVFQGAVVSAAAATFGSSVAFALAKLDTPVRKKALELLDEYPSLRGIEKVVARDGLKAILTLRLAPVLPIPIGMYNYVYGVTSVPPAAFAGGIFLGSLKPYLLDSYLGYFGKQVVEGTESTGYEDIILLVALGVSVLIGVFASQLAAETWDSVLEEVEAEKTAKKAQDGEEEDEDDGITRQVFGWELPQWMVGFQLSLQAADDRVKDMVAAEYDAMVWNYTKAEGGPPPNLDPATQPGSPEIVGANKGIDYASDICNGLVLSPILFSSFAKFADPLYKEEEDEELLERLTRVAWGSSSSISTSSQESEKQALLNRLQGIRSKATQRLELLDERLRQERDRQ